MKVSYLGHASFLLELDDQRILIDPIFRRTIGFLHNSKRPKALVNELIEEGVDLILLTHFHPDHADPKSLAKLPRTKLLMPRVKNFKTHHDVQMIENGEEYRQDKITIKALEANHPTSKLGRLGSAVNAYLIQGSASSVYHAGDTDIHERLKDAQSPNLALVPLGGWAPKLGPGHLDHIRAAEAVRLINPGVVMPMHFDSLHLPGIGFWWKRRSDRNFRHFQELVAESSPAVQALRLAQGESYEI